MKKISPALLLIGLLMVAVGVLMPIMKNDISGMTFRYVFATGAGLALLARLFQESPQAGTPIRIRRLLRLESWSPILLCVAAFFSFYDKTQIRDWLAFTLAGAAIQIYASIALSFAIRKNSK